MDGITKHFSKERYSRFEFIRDNIGFGNVVDSFVVDRGHINGAEIHCVTDTAIIVIYNQRTNNLVTMKIARPKQIADYYTAEGRQAPKKIMDLAREHQSKGYNHI